MRRYRRKHPNYARVPFLTLNSSFLLLGAKAGPDPPNPRPQGVRKLWGRPHHLHSPRDVARPGGHFRVGENSKSQYAMGLDASLLLCWRLGELKLGRGSGLSDS